MIYENSTCSVLVQLINKYSTSITSSYNKKQVIRTSQGKYHESSTMPSSWVELCHKTTNSHLTSYQKDGSKSHFVKEHIVSSNLNLLVHSIQLFFFFPVSIFSSGLTNSSTVFGLESREGTEGLSQRDQVCVIQSLFSEIIKPNSVSHCLQEVLPFL